MERKPSTGHHQCLYQRASKSAAKATRCIAYDLGYEIESPHLGETSGAFLGGLISGRAWVILNECWADSLALMSTFHQLNGSWTCKLRE